MIQEDSHFSYQQILFEMTYFSRVGKSSRQSTLRFLPTMTDRENYEEEIDVGTEGDIEALTSVPNDYIIVQEIDDFLKEPISCELVKIDFTDELSDIDPLTLSKDEEQESCIIPTLSEDEERESCIICKKYPTKHHKAIWFECEDENCEKIICFNCRKVTAVIRRKTPCISCGELYRAGKREFQQCENCKFWRCKYCTSRYKCRCLLLHKLAKHRFLKKKSYRE